MIRRRADIYFGYQFASKAAKPLPEYALKYYIDTLAADPAALHASFAMYRALDTTIAQNVQRKSQQLTMPILAIGDGKHVDTRRTGQFEGLLRQLRDAVGLSQAATIAQVLGLRESERQP